MALQIKYLALRQRQEGRPPLMKGKWMTYRFHLTPYAALLLDIERIAPYLEI